MLIEFAVVENRPFLILFLRPIVSAVVLERIGPGKAAPEQRSRFFRGAYVDQALRRGRGANGESQDNKI